MNNIFRFDFSRNQKRVLRFGNWLVNFQSFILKVAITAAPENSEDYIVAYAP